MERGMAQTFLSRPQLYGGFGDFKRYPHGNPGANFARAQRQRLNIVAVCQCLFLPWVLFSLVYAVVSFYLHYSAPWACWLLVAAGAVVVGVVGLLAAQAMSSRLRAGDKEPTWLVFLFVTMAIGLVLGAILGNVNFWTYMQPYYDLLHMNTYQGVNPATMRGQQLMDAGRVVFDGTATIDIRRSVGFKNLDTYCVAPITVQSSFGPEPLASYDFWAVGLNCCSPNSADFHCGMYSNPHAHAGLRLMRDDQRPFFRLAVQQAEASYNIKAIHPLFFYWMEDPAIDVAAYADDGYKFYLIGMLVHFGWQMFCVILASVSYARLGP